ncbi:MAG TPA: ATPase, partial [Aquifex aeolicus]|nr:ATPase [Aquifex aeolicus]
MKFLRKLTARGENTSGEYVFGELRISPGGRLAGDPDARMEEFWVEVVGTDPAGYWVLVGRRYGQFQLYNWRGDLHRLPSRPPSRSVTDVVFTEEVLCVAAPPHVVLYSLIDPQDPGSWRAHRLSGEGVRPIGGLDAGGDVVAFAGIGERIHLV